MGQVVGGVVDLKEDVREQGDGWGLYLATAEDENDCVHCACAMRCV